MKFLKNFYNELSIFIIFILYFILWHKFNYGDVILNNNSLDQAIQAYNFTPFISHLINNLISLDFFSKIMGNIIFPSCVSLILFIIFKKFTSSNIWSYSLVFLSMSTNENFPFINFLAGVLSNEPLELIVNRSENFEIIGFPIPAFSIFYFLILFYFSFFSLNFNGSKIYILTFFWFLGPGIHPVDGVLGIIYWSLCIIFLLFFKKKSINKFFIFFIISMALLIGYQIFTNIQLEMFVIKSKQSFPIYNLVFYFILPISIIIILIKLIKIDMYEFYSKFLNIYLLMFVEFLIILFSLNGIGVELRMFQYRITQFFLHFLYYLPIIYYLNKDEVFILKNKQLSTTFNYYLTKIIFLVFNKYKVYYLYPFCIMLIVYYVLSLNIYE